MIDLRIGCFVTLGLFALPCVSPTCCDSENQCSGTASCLPTVNRNVCAKGMCATPEEVKAWLKEIEP